MPQPLVLGIQALDAYAAEDSGLLSGVSGQLCLVSAEANWKQLDQVELGEELWSTQAAAGGFL